MSGFEPGEGWREVSEDVFHEGGAVDYAIRRWSDTGRLPTDHVSYWVREVPVPPLPTEPWTTIRVALERPRSVPLEWTLHEGGLWHARLGYYRRADDLGSLITGFEVLAEPRAETAKAVLARVREHVPIYGDKDRMWDIAREFGADA